MGAELGAQAGGAQATQKDECLQRQRQSASSTATRHRAGPCPLVHPGVEVGVGRSGGESPVGGGGELTVFEPGVQKGGARMTPKGWAVILERWPEKRNTIPTPNQPFPAPLPL